MRVSSLASSETKTCSKCKKEKDVSCFVFSNRALGTRHSWCKLCRAEYHQGYRPRHAKSYKKRANALKRAHRRRQRLKIVAYLEDHPCVDCGETDPVVLQFDHRDPKNKKKDIARMPGSCTWDKILQEIAKCDVRCANCHLKKTAIERGWYPEPEAIGLSR